MKFHLSAFSQQYGKLFTNYNNYTTELYLEEYNKQLLINDTCMHSSRMCLMQSTHDMIQQSVQFTPKSFVTMNEKPSDVNDIIELVKLLANADFKIIISKVKQVNAILNSENNIDTKFLQVIAFIWSQHR